MRALSSHRKIQTPPFLEVKPSTIPNAGRGLFTKVPLKKGTVWGDYTVGTEKLTRQEFLARYPSGRATHVALVRGHYYDATRSFVGMANRKPGKNNSRIKETGSMVTTKNVPAGGELLIPYGSGFKIP